ncbi:[protein-PII] uridylyltransferase [Melaminivora jejuensis]|uniref:[protein-PII] uridylyltransferase n=1 Tax=Melaminivora jejuensis TaxID=1267217 RepID=UPI001AE028C1|nr:[protein-PII] uridylyltransferase [Melaminivora jejuensis]UHJ63805.1 [protein-PII] uridylyltransferase [Melaminivora jejuensis]
MRPESAAIAPEVAALRAAYQRDKAALEAVLLVPGASTRGIRSLLRRLTRLADRLLCRLWRRSRLPRTAALVAVGGYGREQLFPHSDVDVLVLLPEGAADAAQVQASVEAFIGSCWDAGLEIGASVRSVAECLRESAANVTVQTALLESRRVCGSAALLAELCRRHAAQLDVRAFMVTKTLEMRQRHTRHDNTPYALEPNCKESPGGLRDLHLILWLARAAGLGHTWRALAASGLATPFEVRQIERNEALLFLIRARLHVLAGRREDRLLFDLQTAVAATFGHIDSPARAGADPRSAARASEALMRRYYWAAKAVSQLMQILLLGIEERLAPQQLQCAALNARFADRGGLLEVASDSLYLQQPGAILETFLLYQTTPGLQGLSARTLRALYNARPAMDARFRRDPANRALFMAILRQPSGITHALRLMNQTSVLGRYLWPFRRIVGQMQHDLFHVYTVDQHTLMVLRNVRRFFLPEHTHEYPLCSRLAGGWHKPWVLYVAALFHDIGKGRGGDHSRIGALEARHFCRQHGIGAEDARLIEFLVAEHLTLSQVAQKQDLSDPAVVQAFAARMGSERHLTGLYLLTVADIRGTSPKVWSAWKGKLLEDLYHAALRVLGGSVPDPAAEVEARKREALILLALHALPPEAYQRLWATLDVGYFMRHHAPDIAWHARHLSRHVGTGQSVVRARRSLAGEGLEVLIYAPDEAELFLRICGYFDNAGFSILDARVHTTSDAQALDTFQVVATDPVGSRRELIQRIESELPHALAQRGAPPEPKPRRASRRARSFPIAPRVSLHPDESGQRWLLSLSAADRAGLLYRVARVLSRHGLSIQLAKVSTLGERVEDSFLLHGPELQSSSRQIEIETELLATLAGG